MPKKTKKEEITEDIKDKTEDTVSRLLDSFFLTKEAFEATETKIKKNSRTNVHYVVLTVFSVLVIMLGMILDSTSVVIGGMFIAPLFWPILGFALGMINGSVRTVTNSFLVLMKSLLLIFGISVVLGFFAPETTLDNAEFIARTSPTIFDLLVGFLAGFLGAYIVAHPKLSSSFAGVVVAAALVPPIAVMGVSITKADYAAFGGSFLLTVSSLIAMTFSAAFLFYIGRLRARKTRTFFNTKNVSWFVFALIVVIIPLAILTNEIVMQERNERIVSAIVEERIPDATLTSASLSNRSGILSINVVINRAEPISERQMSDIGDALSNELEASVVLDVTTIPIDSKREIVNF